MLISLRIHALIKSPRRDILQYPLILKVDSEDPDKTVRMRSLVLAFVVCLYAIKVYSYIAYISYIFCLLYQNLLLFIVSFVLCGAFRLAVVSSDKIFILIIMSNKPLK